MITDERAREVTTAFYRFAGLCHNDGLYIVFKGGCLLRHIFTTADASHETLRKTKDIDFNLCEETFRALANNYRSIIQLEEVRSGGMCDATLLNGSVECDINVTPERDPLTTKEYEGPFGKFRGSTIEKILLDKISSMSGKSIARRHKDLVDIYAIATNCNKLTIDFDILRALLLRNTLGDFSALERDRAHVIKGLSILLNDQGISAVAPEEIIDLCKIFVEGLLVHSSTSMWTGRIWLCG